LEKKRPLTGYSGSFGLQFSSPVDYWSSWSSAITIPYLQEVSISLAEPSLRWHFWAQQSLSVIMMALGNFG
jgi:hypothetical protein